MKTRNGDLWGGFIGDARYATVVTTNGDVNSQGYAVMGRGVAKQAAAMWPDIPRQLGKLLSTTGNHCYVLPVLRQQGAFLVTLPVKHHWKDRANIALIERSLRELSGLADLYGWEAVFLPRPGCGNGGLNWTDVRKVIRPLLDDRFIVMYSQEKADEEKKADAAKPKKVSAKKGAVSKAAQKRMAKK